MHVVEHDRSGEPGARCQCTPCRQSIRAAAGQGHGRHAARQQSETTSENLPGRHLARRNRTFWTVPGVELAVEGIVEKHAPDIEQRHRQQQRRQARIGQPASDQQHTHQDVGPDRWQVGDAPQPEGLPQIHGALGPVSEGAATSCSPTSSTVSSSLRTQANSRATASSTVPLRNGSGSTPQV